MDLIKLAPVSDFDRVRYRTFPVLGRVLGVFRADDGTFVVREARCKHQGADLGAGRLVGTRVTCPRHGWDYDLATGECVNMASLPLRPHGVEIRDGWLWVSPSPLEADAPPPADQEDWSQLFKLKNP